MYDPVLEAARNNAMWCDLVCRTYGLPTGFTDRVWFSRRRSPDFYPDAVTLSPDAVADDVLEQIEDRAGCSVKDSFATLDLAQHGFRILFDAEWIGLDGESGGGISLPGGVSTTWTEVIDAAGLRGFGEAHGAGDIFRPGLLLDPDVAILTDSGRAGAIANLTGDVVGVSNVFGDDWAGAINKVRVRFPGRPLVGYQAGDQLTEAVRVGFDAIGPLRVWIKD